MRKLMKLDVLGIQAFVAVADGRTFREAAQSLHITQTALTRRLQTIELFLGVTGTESGVAHFAHLGGMVGGYVLIQYWRGKLPIKPKRRLMR